MPSKRRKKPLYQRGDFKLYRRDGRANLEIVWYDTEAGRERSRSAGAGDVDAGKKALDALYLEKSEGVAVCPTCLRPWDEQRRFLVTQCIADYLVARETRPSIGSIKPRLAHFVNFMTSTDRLDLSCQDVDADMIEEFREWAADVPIIAPKSGEARDRTPSTIEATVRQLKAAINFSHNRHDTPFPASFVALPPQQVDNTPTFRATVDQIAAMFVYATARNQHGIVRTDRAALLRFLQLSVSTWARPSSVHDVSTAPERGQWIQNANVVRLNPKGRKQTRKFRPDLPVPDRMAKLLSAAPHGHYVGVESVETAYGAMLRDLGMINEGQGGMRLIRRSMATIARNELGDDFMVQIERMLGHRKSSSSDIYALAQPGQLGRCLAVTEGVIEQIVKVAPLAFYRTDTALKIINGGQNAQK